MPIRAVQGANDRFDRLASIERLLDQYRLTKDRRLLQRAIELWDATQAEDTMRAANREHQIH